MKSTLLFAILFLAVSFSLNAQAVTISPANPVDSGATSISELKIVSTITNNTDSMLTLRWARTSNNLPVNWSSAVCDPVTCWAPFVDSKTFTLNPQETNDFSVTFYPNGTDGTGTADLYVYAVYDSANINASNTYTGFIDASVNTNNVWEEDNIRMYPNPASDYIMLSDNKNASHMIIYNIVGKQMKTYQLQNEGSRYNIKSFPRGMYIVRLVDNKQKVVKTFRLSKR